ncbi:hypothetical protein ACFSO0_18500 [Brevibacillus sp. GCM10020057]|uniref:hypothetical protein n=1 Tax=Brevibacillus sp. GCM10020057 TaxID=3317327 RepID=UPI003643673E
MNKGAWQIAVLFAGGALGGTYLGGYEWLRFFAYFGSWGTIGAALVSIALGWLGYTALIVCHRSGIRSLHELFLHWFGEAIGPSLSVLSHLFLLAYAGVITGQYAAQLADGAAALLYVLLPVLIAVVCLRKSWSWVLPGLAIFLVLGSLVYGSIFIEQHHVPIPSLGYQMNLNWLVHAVLYTGLHFLLCLALTIPFASTVESPQPIRLGIGAGSLFFFLVLLTGQAVLLSYWHDVLASEVPVKLILTQLLPIGGWLHTILALVHGGVVIAALVLALASPIAERHDLHLLPLIAVMLFYLALCALLPLVLTWSVSAIVSGTTYCGLCLIICYIWKRQLS